MNGVNAFNHMIEVFSTEGYISVLIFTYLEKQDGPKKNTQTLTSSLILQWDIYVQQRLKPKTSMISVVSQDM